MADDQYEVGNSDLEDARRAIRDGQTRLTGYFKSRIGAYRLRGICRGYFAFCN